MTSRAETGCPPVPPAVVVSEPGTSVVVVEPTAWTEVAKVPEPATRRQAAKLVNIKRDRRRWTRNIGHLCVVAGLFTTRQTRPGLGVAHRRARAAASQSPPVERAAGLDSAPAHLLSACRSLREGGRQQATMR